MQEVLVTILVAEDDRIILDKLLDLIKQTFKSKVHLLSATAYHDAKKIIEAGEAQLFVLDVRFPDGNGLNLMPLIRERYPQNTVIFQSIVEDEVFRLKIYDTYDHVKYLTKEEVFTKITKELKKGMDALSNPLAKRIIIGRKQGDIILNPHNICFVSTLPDKVGLLEVTLFDFQKNDFRYLNIPNMTLTYFLEHHDEFGLFILATRDRIVNRNMIERVDYKNDAIFLKVKNLKIQLSRDAIRKKFKAALRKGSKKELE